MKAIIVVVITCINVVASAQTERITFKAPVMYPEGIAYDAKNDKFYVSSVKTATIGTVDRQGKYTPFYEDSTLKSSFGLKNDGKKLWLCTGDPTYSKYGTPQTKKKLIKLVGIDVATGKKTDDIDLSSLVNGNHFLNDMAIADDGTKYLTDSYSPVIYKVSNDGKAEVFLQDSMLKGKDVGLNGIVWNKKGYLVVANGSTGALLKIDIATKKISKIKIDQFFSGADGLLWDKDANLILVQNKGVHKVFKLVSTDDWVSAKVTEATQTTDRFAQPSTSTLDKDGKIYVLNSKLNELSDPTAKPSEEFSIQVVRFVPVK